MQIILEKEQEQVTCRFCDKYAGRVSCIREYGCPDCEKSNYVVGHHHHILYPALEEVTGFMKSFKKPKLSTLISPEMRREFEEWKERKYSSLATNV